MKNELERRPFLVEADEWLQGLQEGPQPRHLEAATAAAAAAVSVYSVPLLSSAFTISNTRQA